MRKELKDKIEDQFGVKDYVKLVKKGKMSIMDVFVEAYLLGMVSEEIEDNKTNMVDNWYIRQ